MVWSNHLDIDDLLNAMQLGVVVHEADTRILDANPRALELLQITHNQAIGVDAFSPGWHFISESGDLLLPKDFPVNQVAESDGPLRNFTLGIVASSSSSVTWVSCNGYRRAKDDRIVITFVDISEEVCAKRSLAEALEAAESSRQELLDVTTRLEVALSAIDAHTYGLDLETGLVTFDEDFSAVLGYPAGELKSITLARLADITHPEDLKTRREALDAVKRGDASIYRHVARLRHSDGHWVWVENRAIPISDGGGSEANHTIGAIIDITQRKNMESALLQNQKMEALGTLAGGIAHDFNNLLAPILGYADLATRNLPSESKEARYLAQIVKAAERAKGLVRKILLVSRSSVLDREIIVIPDLVREVLEVVSASSYKGVSISADYANNLPETMADPSNVYQVLLNLCTNALQSMGHHGALTISVAHCSEAPGIIDAQQAEKGYIVINIRDTGCGMDADTAARMFDPFFTTKNKGEERGSGLGMSIVAGVVSEHAGAIDVQSELGSGTSISVYLPVTHVLRETAVSESASAFGHEKVHIMLVDDEEQLRELGEAMLVELGFDVTTFGDGQDAIDALKQGLDRFQLLLTDYDMPCMNGSELTDEIRRIAPDLPILMMTGFSQLASIESGLGDKCDGVIAKPFDLKSLSTAVNQGLSLL